jgi:hypothetical protein
VKPAGTGRDIQLLGGLFLIVGTVNLVIIALFPAYAGFGLVSEAMNQLTFGFNSLRSGFMAATFLFASYLIRRRAAFIDESVPENRPKPEPQELL